MNILIKKIVTIVFVIAPFIAMIYGVWKWHGNEIDAAAFFLFIAGYFITAFGITIGFHRCFTHKSFVITKPWLKWLLLISGSAAAQGPVIQWCATHNQHHAHTDDVGDPHSPHYYGPGFWNKIRGGLHAHIFWMFDPPDLKDKYVQRLCKDPDLVKASKQFILWVAFGLLFPSVLGMVLRISTEYLFIDFIMRCAGVFFVHHVTWSINSLCHLFGRQPFKTGDESRNLWIVALFANGEGWHNGHHAFQRSARHGLLKGEFDLSWLIIRFFEKRGWVEKVYVPTQEIIDSKLS